MSEGLQIGVSFAAGALLGTAVLWGLWLTVDGLHRARHPALRVLVSLGLRFGLAIAGFYLIVHHGGWVHTVAAALGFMLVRLLAVRRLWPAPAREESDA